MFDIVAMTQPKYLRNDRFHKGFESVVGAAGRYCPCGAAEPYLFK